jgi:hypothetical protein
MLRTYLTQAILFGLVFNSIAQETNPNFAPPAKAPLVYTVRAHTPIHTDGKLDEPDWQKAPLISDFFRQEPRQGGTVTYYTQVRLLYDDKNLYVGAFCYDPAGKKGFRAQDLRRDFSFGENDIFAVNLDPQNLRRYCVSFQTTPYGNQRDKQVFDDRLNDQDWDALWRVRTHAVDSGWYAEFEIPFKSLRYNQGAGADSLSWGIIFSRLARRDYELSVFPAIPQSFTSYRMTYAAELKGLDLPPPGVNVRIQPYALFTAAATTNGQGQKSSTADWKAGGEVKWAVNPSTVLDLTFNTDFAQADVDRAVNNLTRFNILFPERRQFFLENNGVYAGTNVRGINPFFTRTIGLADAQFNADPVPIDFGARYTDRNTDRTWAGLYVRQRSTAQQGAANFAVARYLKNYGSQNNTGLMVTHRHDEQLATGRPESHNTTLTWDGLIRPKDTWTITYLASGSRQNNGDTLGFAATVAAEWSPVDWYGAVRTRYVSSSYTPGMGFVFQNDVLWNNAILLKIVRPKGWLGKIIRRWDPGVLANYYQDGTRLRFQSADLDFFPFYTVFADNSEFNISYMPTWEYFFFRPLGIPVAPGQYQFDRWLIRYSSDASKKVSGRARYEWGKFYDGNLNIWTLGARIVPVPQVALTLDYEQQQIRSLGINAVTRNNDLITAGMRLAWNPRIQFSGFYQYNSFDKQSRWNMRASWEFAPLSFLFIVFNENSFADSRNRNQAVINKLTWLKQF